MAREGSLRRAIEIVSPKEPRGKNDRILAHINHELLPERPQDKPTTIQLAEALLMDLDFRKDDLQGLLQNLGEFQNDELFHLVGTFVSIAINKLMLRDNFIELNLNNQAPVKVPPDFMKEGQRGDVVSLVESATSRTFEYYRTQLLLSYLATDFSYGKLILHGNVGGFFAYKASGGELDLNGKTGENPGAELLGADVTINGYAGHGLLAGGIAGTVRVNGRLCCLAQDMSATVDPKLRCYLNEKQIWVAEHKDEIA
jgi:hypothetical protein